MDGKRSIKMVCYATLRVRHVFCYNSQTLTFDDDGVEIDRI